VNNQIIRTSTWPRGMRRTAIQTRSPSSWPCVTVISDSSSFLCVLRVLKTVDLVLESEQTGLWPIRNVGLCRWSVRDSVCL